MIYLQISCLSQTSRKKEGRLSKWKKQYKTIRCSLEHMNNPFLCVFNKKYKEKAPMLNMNLWDRCYHKADKQWWWFIIGIGNSLEVMIVPLYISENTPPIKRGLCNIFPEFCGSGEMFLSYYINFIISKMLNPDLRMLVPADRVPLYTTFKSRQGAGRAPMHRHMSCSTGPASQPRWVSKMPRVQWLRTPFPW
jgi:hypothetical protein